MYLPDKHEPVVSQKNQTNMGPRKGMSLADKRSNILSIFHESKSIYVLKARAECVFKIREFVRPSNPRVLPRLRPLASLDTFIYEYKHVIGAYVLN